MQIVFTSQFFILFTILMTGYFSEGKRTAIFLGEEVVKYHKTLTTYINSLLQTGFEICELIEPQPSEMMLDTIPEMQDELRRPMMLLISAKKKS